MDAVETRMGKKTIEFHSVSKAFGDKTLMKDFEYIFLATRVSVSSARTAAENLPCFA